MNVFEDLIEELKEYNLIEETVIETSKAERAAPGEQIGLPAAPELKNAAIENLPPPIAAAAAAESVAAPAAPEKARAPEAAKTSPTFDYPIAESDFYRRRATEEVAALQIAENVIANVEREQMKVAPKPYDDLPVKLALHDFLQITCDVESSEHSIAEFKLMQETELWHSALAQRDKLVGTADLRRYCESARPPLSPQALISLARFYRNSPFSSHVRSKFEMIVTRLTTGELAGEKRKMLFQREELIERLTGLYADWSSIPLYADDDDSEVLLAVLKFEDFIREAKEADSFDELVRNDFFNRLRSFKDATGENFYSPLMTATAIECNVVVGNCYVDLINAERESSNAERLGEKYKSLLDPTVADATSKTLQLVKLLSEKKEEPEFIEPAFEEIKTEESEVQEPLVEEATNANEAPVEVERAAPETEKSGFAGLQINKWILIAAAIALLAVGGLYLWVEHVAVPTAEESPNVEKVSLESSPLKEYFKAGRINEGTYYAITQPAWNELPNEMKTDVLRKMLAEGAQKGYAKIHLINGEGKNIGFASAEKGIELNGF